jgi:hypothetical protein
MLAEAFRGGIRGCRKEDLEFSFLMFAYKVSY